MKTIKIRAAVAVDKNGDWTVVGNSDIKGDENLIKCLFLDTLEPGERYSFIEAEVPMPEAITIQAKLAPTREATDER